MKEIPPKTKALYAEILEKQSLVAAVPPNEDIAKWASQLICLLFPELSTFVQPTAEVLQHQFSRLEKELVLMLDATKECCHGNNDTIAEKFFESFFILSCVWVNRVKF